MKRKFVFLTFVLVVIGLITFFSSCEKEELEQQDSVLSSNRYDVYGKQHNEILKTLLRNKDNLTLEEAYRSIVKTVAEMYDTTETVFPSYDEMLSEITPYIDSSSNFVVFADEKYTQGKISETQKDYFYSLDSIIKGQDFENKINDMENTLLITNSLTLEEKDPLLAGAAMAKYSFELWSEQAVTKKPNGWIIGSDALVFVVGVLAHSPIFVNVAASAFASYVTWVILNEEQK